jgi:hypothetical protein
MTAVLDNDIALKCVCYDIATELLGSYCESGSLGVLGSAQYVISKRLRNKSLNCGGMVAVERLNVFLNSTECIEPSTEESYFAAELELIAQREGVALDSGESQLCAIAITRFIPWLLTGDKRAIRGLQRVLGFDSRLKSLGKRVLCLEQLVLRAIADNGIKRLRDKICAEPAVDKTMSICFSCTNIQLEVSTAGLTSYIESIKSEAPEILSD